MSNGFEWSEVFVTRERYTSGSASDTGDCRNVSSYDLWYSDSITTNHHADLLNTFWLCSTDGEDGFTLRDCTGVNTTDSNFTSVRIHPNLCDHHSKFCFRVTSHHGLTNRGFKVTSPNVRDTVGLSLNWAWQLGYSHVKKNFVNWCSLCKFLLLLIVTVLENVGHGYARLLHVRDGNTPVVVSTTECNSTVHNTDLPFFLEFFRSELLDQFVDLGNGFLESVHHVFRGNLKFVDESVDLVDEENRLHLLLECLTDNSLSLRHWAFNSTSKNETTVNSTHSTSNVATKVDVTRCVDEIDEVICSFNGVNHGSGCSVDGNSTSRFLLVKVENTGSTSQIAGHHSCSSNQVVRECRLSVINVRSNAQISNLWKNVHNFCSLFDVVFFSSHGIHLSGSIRPLEWGS